MGSSKTNIRRSFYALGFVLLGALVIGVLSKVYESYTQTDQKLSLLEAQKSYAQFRTPKVHWIDFQTKGTKATAYEKQKIAEAYFRGLQALNSSRNIGKSIGLEDHFGSELLNQITLGLSPNSGYEKLHVSHALELRFMSLDRSVVSLRDQQSLAIEKSGKEHVQRYESYNAVMVLTDGRWHIEGLEKIHSAEADVSKEALALSGVEKWRGINYYPSKHPWLDFWINFDADIVDHDLGEASSLGFNCIRFFIPYEIFGGPSIHEEYLLKMDQLIYLAKRHDLKLIPCLFDFPSGYSLHRYLDYDRHLEILLSRYNQENTIVLWDIKNEPDLDFAIQGEKETMHWLKFILMRARSYTNQPLTIGWSKVTVADRLHKELNVLSFHAYEDVSSWREEMNALKSFKKPLLISEFGRSNYSGIWPGGFSDQQQGEFLNEVLEVLDETNSGGLIWCLYDYEEAPKNVFGWKPWVRAKQKNFGLIDLERNKKRAIETIAPRLNHY